MKRLAAGIIATLFLFAPFAAGAAPAPSAGRLLSKLKWRSIGPFIGGRVVAVAGVPSEPNLFYMGAVQGGVWRSDDDGQSWENITDGKILGTATSIGALAVAPSNPSIIYAGTGESEIRGDFDTGEGVYKSTDAGKTWHYAGLRDTHTISSIAIDPRNPDVVYVTSLGHVFVPNAQRGVFKTTDGGKTWKNILYVDDKTGANNIVIDQHDPNVLYASMWEEQRTPWHLTSGGPGSGLYKSTDGGARWTKISGNPGFARGVLGKMGVAVAPSDSRIVYAIVQARDGGVFRSGDGGATWGRVNASWKLRQRAFYYMAIYVDPKDPNTVFAPQVDSVWKSTDGGTHWKPLMPPGDHHIIWINPRDTQIMVEGDDGGATVSVNGGKTWSTEFNQPTGQFYHITLDDRFPYHVYGAQQDEGAFEMPSASHEGLTVGSVHPVALGESTFIAVDPNDPDVTYGAGYFSSLVRLNRATGDEKNVSPWPLYLSGLPAAAQKYRFGWTHPILFSPAKPDELFETAQVVFKSDDFGKTWTVISPDLTRNVASTEGSTGGPVYPDITGVEVFPDVSSFAISALSAGVMWAGSQDGLVHVTTDAGKSWPLVTPPALPQWAEITSIEPSHADANTAYVTASRFQWDDFHPYIYKTTDAGAHWTALTNGIPDDQYVFVVREDPRDPRVLFAGTRSTVYVSLDAGARWQPLTLNLPGVQVRDIAVDARQGQVAIATHGRGFWILDDLALLEQLASDPAQMLFAPETAWLTHDYGGPASAGPNAGENPKYGATVFFDIPKSYDGRTPVTLSFLDSAGKTVRTYALHLRNPKAKKLEAYRLAQLDAVAQAAYRLERSTAIAPGMNAFRWDLRATPATEIRGFHPVTTDDFSDDLNGPTVLPGEYTVELDYGGKRVRRAFKVKLDPRVHPGAEALQARFALATRISDTLDALDRAVNAALAARDRMPAARRAQCDAAIARAVDLRFDSSEADVMFPTALRDHLAFLMNELDLAYQAPTAAEQSTYERLRRRAAALTAQLDALAK
jgi:photosystem II stability/assembly factor-like uncharacterized protein